jgi:carotenoid 1,2-hydratase
MTEVPPTAVRRDADGLHVGGSHVRWAGDVLEVDFAERTAPWGRPLAGRVRLHPAHRFAPQVDLSGDGVHRWYPVAPLAHAEVTLTAPSLRFAGPAYHDVNHGDAPLEQHFARWDWSRISGPDAATVLYDTALRGGGETRFGRRFGRDGQMTPVDPAQPHDLGRTGWRMPRHTRAEVGQAAATRRTLVDAPFYSRSWLTVGAEHGIHESVDLDRFGAGWVRFLLPFKMRGGWGR